MSTEVRRVLEMPLTTVVSDPVRGVGGSPSYRGNWSPRLVERVLAWLEPRRVFDPTVGGGTTAAVCERLGVECEAYDLNPAPPIGVGNFDMLTDDPDKAADLILTHPAYWNVVPYSGSVWGHEPDPRDLSQIAAWPDFVLAMNKAVLHLWATLRVGGHLALLVGDIARSGRLYSMQHEIAWCGEPVRTIIKLQHNATSYRTSYVGRRFVPIVHEYLLVFRKTSPYSARVVYTVTRDVNLRRRELTWAQIVQAAVEALGGQARVDDVYREVEQQFGWRTEAAHWWREKVRQTLQGPRFVRVERGVYAIA